MDKLYKELLEMMEEEKENLHYTFPESMDQEYYAGRVNMLTAVLSLVSSYKDGFR